MDTQKMRERFIAGNERMKIESLFACEETYWLTAAIATGFALQALLGKPADDLPAVAIDRFHETIRAGEVSDKEFDDAKAQTLDNLRRIHEWNNLICVFDYEKAFALCGGFTSYWLFTKLIEVEWQKVLGQEALRDSYQFLDGVLEDRAEFEQIEEKYRQGHALLDDEIIFLRSHWEAARIFFSRMEADMKLLKRGIIPFETRS